MCVFYLEASMGQASFNVEIEKVTDMFSIWNTIIESLQTLIYALGAVL